MKTKLSQRNHEFTWLCALLLFVGAAPCLSSQTVRSLPKINSKQVATFFFYWYDVHSGRHFRNPDGSDALTDHPPKDYLFNYSFTDLDWHRRELLDMIDAKIDIVLPVYWGTDYTKEKHVWLDFGAYALFRGLSPAGNAPDGAWRTRVLDGREAAFPAIDALEPSYYIYLDVCNDFIHSKKNEVWITVEYFDQGHDVWCIDYDGVDYSYSSTPDVVLQDSNEWKQHTFHLTDAYFGGRQNFGADLRLSNRYDGKTNYFGRVWVSKVPPANISPDLKRLKYMTVKPGAVRELAVSASDPEGQAIKLSLEKEIPFVSLLDFGTGSGLLRIAPEKEHVRSCPYWVLIVATDFGQPSLSDAVPLRLKVKN